jgi:hypothetical protein
MDRMFEIERRIFFDILYVEYDLEKIHMRVAPAEKIQQRNSLTTTRSLWLRSTPSCTSCSSCPCSFCSRRNGTQFTGKFTCVTSKKVQILACITAKEWRVVVVGSEIKYSSRVVAAQIS